MGGTARAAEVYAWIRTHGSLSEPDREDRLANGQPKLENWIGWARFYLSKKGLVASDRRGVWILTDAGRGHELTPAEAYTLFRQVHATFASPRADEEIDTAPAPEEETSVADTEMSRALPTLPDAPIYWFVGTIWGEHGDQLERFRDEGLWENGYNDQFTDDVRRMRPGERVAAKASFVRKHNLPFATAGQPVSVMRIKATGTVLENLGDGKRVRVAWDPPSAPREWCFYTFRTTIVGVSPDDAYGQRLIAFTFLGEAQEYAYWLNESYWAGRYRAPDVNALLRTNVNPEAEALDEVTAEAQAQPYTPQDIIADGCFLPEADLAEMLDRLRARKNLVLQGPPGTGKTWLAKRLAAALIGRSPLAAANRLVVLQFHPSLSYEDFVRGWRPNGTGGLKLTDGVFLEAVTAARSEPDTPFVVVIEEINRGNPAQIFGELLTLLEHDKRVPDEGIALAYPKPNDRGERIWLPENLYVIGTMNIADRSLALVDLALRRRFSFKTLSPQFNDAWRTWCGHHPALTATVLDTVAARMERLNGVIAQSLGEQFRIGHSYVTPSRKQIITDGRTWFAAIVDSELGPLLAEYFYDDPQKADALLEDLCAGW